VRETGEASALCRSLKPWRPVRSASAFAPCCYPGAEICRRLFACLVLSLGRPVFSIAGLAAGITDLLKLRAFHAAGPAAKLSYGTKMMIGIMCCFSFHTNFTVSPGAVHTVG